MDRVDFYVLEDSSRDALYRMACRLTEKAFLLGHRVHIHTDALETAQEVDRLLWSFRDRSFVPHEIEPQTPDVWPVTIGYRGEPATQAQVLVNLAAEVPPFFERFERVVELTNQDPAVRQHSRSRYRHYRERGCTLEHHRIR